MDIRQAMALLATGRRLEGRIDFQGLKISIENKKGNVRTGVSKDGKKWSTTMHAHYGYCLQSKGVDGEHVDVYVGQNPNATKAYVIHQLKANGKYDEDKVMLGFNSAMDAKRVYLKHIPEKFYGSMTIMTMENFKRKVLTTKGKKLKAMHDFRDSPAFDSPGKFHSPSNLKSGKSYIPTDDPGEMDNKYMDVERRNSKETIAERHRLMNTKPAPVHVNKTQQTPNFDDPSPMGTRGTFGIN